MRGARARAALAPAGASTRLPPFSRAPAESQADIVKFRAEIVAGMAKNNQLAARNAAKLVNLKQKGIQRMEVAKASVEQMLADVKEQESEDGAARRAPRCAPRPAALTPNPRPQARTRSWARSAT